MPSRNDEYCSDGRAAPRAEPVPDAAAIVLQLEHEVTRERARLASGGVPPTRRKLADLLHRQGAACLAAGEPAQALTCWIDAHTACDATVEPMQSASIGADLARLRLMLGRPDDAARTIDEVLVLLRGRRGAEADLATALGVSASIHSSRRAYPEARVLLREAIQVIDSRLSETRYAGDARLLAHLLLDLGRIELTARDWEAARETFGRALTVSEAIASAEMSLPARNTRNAALNYLGRAEEQAGEIDRAEALFARSAADMRELVEMHGRDDLADDLARAEGDLARLRAARTLQ